MTLGGSESEPGAKQIPEAVIGAATRILGHPLALDEVELLEGRGTVAAVGRPDGSQVVIKWSKWRQVLLAEWSALAGLADIGLDPPVSPRLLGGDIDAGVIVLERLPPGPSLASLLLGVDGAAARRGLVGLGRALGRLHAATAGRTREFELRRARLGPTQSVRYHVVRRLPELLANARDRTIRMGLIPPLGLETDLQQVRDAVARPGPFLSLIHGDPCPDNNRIYGDRAVLIDFQVAAIDHCLLDGVFFSVPFPTCWCVAGLDGGDAGPATDAYREELAKGVPEAYEDRLWLQGLTEASACWFLLHLVTDLDRALQEDHDWGTATMAQRFVQWSTCFTRLAERAGTLPSLGDLAGQVHDLVRTRWPDIAPPSAYPALAVLGRPVVARPGWWEPAP